ncbi:potassium transporter [Violaceomyces palustris]|uniref:Potassium transporter n=1 Tax=Violaceomyces palustris TaxID=1673888 RepID=A0ACD0P6E1_9BASI|nr:potassium transporter [Violaceomyces palustris]
MASFERADSIIPSGPLHRFPISQSGVEIMPSASSYANDDNEFNSFVNHDGANEPQKPLNSDFKRKHFEADNGEFKKHYQVQRVAVEEHGWALAQLAFQAIGNVCGDIGTSPLYVLNGIFPASGPPPTQEDVIGVVSSIIWLFTIVVIFKYASIVLYFGTGEGEGGTFALFQGLFPRSATDDDDADGSRGRALTFVSTKTGSIQTDRRSLLLRVGWIKPALCALALFGSGLTLADGILTPAVSVVSAAEGIAVVEPSLGGDAVVGIAIAILAMLVLIQPFGIKRITIFFSPCVCLWLLFLLITGAINCHAFPGIWRAWDPSRAILYFVRTKNFDALSGVVLAITGCEAFFANLGSFSRNSMRLPIFFLVYPSLMLAYLGQGAKLCEDPATVVANVFYLSIPGGAGGAVYWLGFALGLLATIIASQAMISASFNIVMQLMHMKCFPMVAAKHTDDNHIGQVYLPVINYLLGVGIVGVVAGFRSSANLTEAYGFAVVTVMLITTIEVALQIYFVKKLPWILAVLFFLGFGFVDATLWGAVLKKVPEGAWFSLGLGLLLAIFLCWWTWATSLVHGFDKTNRVLLTSLLARVEKEVPSPDAEDKARGTIEGKDAGVRMRTVDKFADQNVYAQLILKGLDGIQKPLLRMTTLAVFWKPAGGLGVPHTFAHFLTKYPACPSVVVFLSVRVLAVPVVDLEDQLIINKTRTFSGIYGVTLRLGYRDHLDLSTLGQRLVKGITDLERLSAEGRGDLGQAELDKTIRMVQEAAQTVTHFYPNYYCSARPLEGSLRARKVWKQKLDDRSSLFSSSETASQLTEQTRCPSSLLSKVFVMPLVTAADYTRLFLIEGLYRRVKGAFADEDGPFDSSEEIIRVTVTAHV